MTSRPPPAGLEEALRRLEAGESARARTLLERLDAAGPPHPAVLTALVNACYDMGDVQAYENACRKLQRLVPPDPDLVLSLAGACLENARPALACRGFRRFLERWPGHPRADEVRACLADLDRDVGPYLESLGLLGPEALKRAAEHEEATALAEQGDLREARRILERLLRQAPRFVPALNNASQLFWLDGHRNKAIATARRALEQDPDNYHALANLARFLHESGQVDEARGLVERLERVSTDRPDAWAKHAEALESTGDHAGAERIRARRLPGQAWPRLRLPRASAASERLRRPQRLRLVAGTEGRHAPTRHSNTLYLKRHRSNTHS